MERSKAYDFAIKQSSNLPDDLFEEKDGVYLNEKYRKDLLKEIEKKGFTKQFENEYNKYYDRENHKKCKMCSIASSSRLCFLKFKDIPEITFEEIIDNKNVCKPHLDAFNTQSHVYYECKCHEIVGTHGVELSPKYKSLLEELFHFHVQFNKNGKIQIDYKDFGVTSTLKCGKYFDFKQFICHVIGLLTLPNGPKPTLQYVFFQPEVKYLNEEETLRRWKKEFSFIEKKLFEELRNIRVYTNGKQDRLSNLVELPDPLVILVSEI